MEQKSLEPKSTKEFVKYINKNWNKNPEYFTNVLHRYLQSTLKDGYISVTRRPSTKEILIEKAINPVCGLEKIERIAQIQPFLEFKWSDAMKISKTYIMDFLTGGYMDDFNYATTPCRYIMGDESISVTWAKYHIDDLFCTFDTLVKNSHIFEDKDVERFVKKYVETLFLRTKAKPEAIIARNVPPLQVDNQKSVCVYDKMQGMYHYDAQVLLDMAKVFAVRGLNTDFIHLALEKLPFEEDLGNDDPKYQKRCYAPIYDQMDSFEEAVSQAMFVIENKDKIFEAAHGKKKLALLKDLVSLRVDEMQRE